MKRLILIISILLSIQAFAAPEGNAVSMSRITAALSEIRNCPGAELVRLGRVPTAALKGVLRLAAAGDPQPARSFRWVPYTAVAVAASIALVAVLSIDKHSPKDTFDNPYLAYKQVEATFGSISEKMSAGALLAGKAEEAADKAIKIIDNITE